MWKCKTQFQYLKFILKLRSQLRYFSTPIRMAFSIYESQETNQNLPPLIIMHGFLSSRAIWKSTAIRLESELKRKVFTCDLRNHGESPHIQENTYQDMTNDLLKFMQDHSVSKATLLGYGIGGCVAMCFALQYPTIVENGIIIDAVPLSVPRKKRNEEEILFIMKKIQICKQETEEQGREEMKSLLENAGIRAEVITNVMNYFRMRGNGEFYWSINIESLYANLKELSFCMVYVKQMTPFLRPMLLLCDNYSQFINDKNLPILKVNFPNAQVEWLNVNKLTYVHQSERFFELIIEFLKKN